MLMIRLQRTGRKHEPTFRVVLTDSKNGPKSGKYLANLGWYDTRIKNKIDQMDTEKIKYWMTKGVKLSVTLHNYLVTQKVISAKKINALPRKTPIKKVEDKGTLTQSDAKPEAKKEAAAPAEAPKDAAPAPAPAA